MKLNEYNKESVDKIIESFNKHERVLYVSGVGTGKSFVVMQFLIMHPEMKALFVVPKHAIKENMCRYKEFKEVATQVDFCTYNRFTSIDTGFTLIEPYDMVIIDEAHHVGSDLYGKTLLTCMKWSKNKYFLGLTATPIREDGHVDVSQFFDARVDGISHFEAIKLGLMPKFEYRLSVPEIDIKNAQKDNPENYIKLDFCDCESVMKNIEKKFNRKKWICFFHSIASIEQNKDMIARIFKKYDIYVLHSSLNNIDGILDEFYKSKKAVILSCNMLLEGVHIPGVDGVALFRNVTSLVAFQQMLGRICRIGSTVEPVVVDNSISGPKMFARLLAANGCSTGRKNACSNAKDVMHVGLSDHKAWEGVDEFLKKLDNRKMSEEEQLERANAALIKYLAFNGSTRYNTFSELKSNDLDFKKFKACAEINELSPERAFIILSECGQFTTYEEKRA